MARIGLFVEPNFLSKHVGVRNVIFTIYEQLRKDNEVFFLSVHDDLHLEQWFIHHIPDVVIENNGFTKSVWYEGEPNEVFTNYLKNAPSGSSFDSNKCDQVYYSQIGSNIDLLNLDWLLISSPWCLRKWEIPKGVKIAALVHDVIPNRYVFESAHSNKPFEFAKEHNIGYENYLKYADLILTNSNYTSKEFIKYYQPDIPVVALTPLTPNGVLGIEKENISRSSRRIILGNFLDERKGLKFLMEILETEGVFDEVILYGQPRCSEQMLKLFFSKIKSEKIKWYIEISSKQLRKELLSSNLMLFPSKDEGLGLPVIEAQYFGVPVLTSFFGSVSEVQLDESMIINWNDFDYTKSRISSILDEKFDHESLITKAEESFSPEKLRAILNSSLR